MMRVVEVAAVITEIRDMAIYAFVSSSTYELYAPLHSDEFNVYNVHKIANILSFTQRFVCAVLFI